MGTDRLRLISYGSQINSPLPRHLRTSPHSDALIHDALCQELSTWCWRIWTSLWPWCFEYVKSYV